MTKEMEQEIDELYKLLEITQKDDKKTVRVVETDCKRTNNFFEKRWDSSFFASAVRY